MLKPLNFVLKSIAKKFKDDPSKMIIRTSVIGWAISSAAQIFAIAANQKIKKEQKGFLIPQELYDAVTNIAAYLLITMTTKRTVSKLFSSGKWTTKNIRGFLHKNAELYGKKVGNVDFDLGKVLENDKNLLHEYETTKSFGTTAATIGAGIVSANIVTPLIRNKMASSIQKSYIKFNNELQAENGIKDNTTFKANPYHFQNINGLKI